MVVAGQKETRKRKMGENVSLLMGMIQQRGGG